MYLSVEAGVLIWKRVTQSPCAVVGVATSFHGFEWRFGCALNKDLGIAGCEKVWLAMVM